MKIAILGDDNSDKVLLHSVEQFTQLPVLSKVTNEFDFYLLVDRKRLKILINKPKAPLPIQVDFLSGEWEFKIKTLGKNQIIYKAIGWDKNPPSILDATAGLGQDLFSFLVKGCRVTAVEQNPYIYLILKNGLERAFEAKKWEHLKDNLQLTCGDTFEFLVGTRDAYDVIYLDPMYGTPSDKSKSKKEMEFLREFLNPGDNSQKLLDLALTKAKKRVVIKRPVGSDFLNPKPTHTFQGRSTRFDMYITNN